MEQLFLINRSNEHATYLSGGENFRYRIYPEYKANRKAYRPKWLEECKEFLISEYGADVTVGYEADDGIGIKATELGPANITICSIDKDLKQIPGKHHNWVKNEYTEVDELQGMYNFYWHCLVGDTSDNIKGCPKIGEVKATKHLAGGKNPRDWFRITRDLFDDDKKFRLAGQLIWVLRHEEDGIWEFPDGFEDKSGERGGNLEDGLPQ